MRRPPRDDYLNVKSNWEEIVIESLMRNAGNLVSRASIRKPLRRRVGKFEFAFAGMNAETFRFKHAETRQPNVLTFFFPAAYFCLYHSSFCSREKWRTVFIVEHVERETRVRAVRSFATLIFLPFISNRTWLNRGYLI